MNRYHQLSEEKRNFSINFDQSRESAIIIRPPHVGINMPNAGAHQWAPANDDPDTTERNAMTLLHRYTRLCFFFAGQWFWPAENFIKRHNLPRKVCRIAYAIWQGIVVLIMWSYFLYSMGSFPPQTIEEVDWLCPLTDIKNMAHGLCWIVNQHTGLVFFLFGNFERLLKQLSITKEEVKRRASSHSISVFLVNSVAWLFIVPITLHATQMLMPDFLPMPRYRDGKITATSNNTFPATQIAFDVIFFAASRGFSLPIFYAFLYMMLFLCCEVDKFKDELGGGLYPTEDKARKKAIKIRTLIKETEKAFRFFLVLYITMILLASALEIFSIVEKAETVIMANHTVYELPASAAAASVQTLNIGSKISMPFPHRLTGNRAIPYYLVVIPPSNHTVGMSGGEDYIPKNFIDQYKITTQEIVVTAVLDITENVVLYAFPLYQMSVLKSCLKRVLEMVEDSDYGAQETHLDGTTSGDNAAQGIHSDDTTSGDYEAQGTHSEHTASWEETPKTIFRTRQEKKDFTNWFRTTCISGVKVLGREVSFLWALVLTFFGPFVVVVVNLMFKHIHVESPWH